MLHKKPLKSAGFRVLRAPDVPSVLVELGYVSNRADLKSLLSETWRDRTAASMVSNHGLLFRGSPDRNSRRRQLKPLDRRCERAANGLSLNKKRSDETR